MAARIEADRVVSQATAEAVASGPPHTLSLILTICLSAGIASPLLGLILSIVHSLVPGDTLIAKAAMGFTFVSIPLLLAGAHLMDVIAKRRT